jgi:hypothetical protein
MSFVRASTAAAGVPRIAAVTAAVRNAAGTSTSARAMVSSAAAAIPPAGARPRRATQIQGQVEKA